MPALMTIQADVTYEPAKKTMQQFDAVAEQPLSDEGREAQIIEYSKQIERAVATGDRRAAEAAKCQMYDAIKSRTPEYIAKLEMERGLR